MPKLVVLDGWTLNPGDLDWGGLRGLVELVVHERSEAGEVLDRLRGASMVLTNKVPLGRALLEALPDLRYIGVTATGFNIVDVAAARELGIAVTNVPAYGTESVAQMVFALLLELTHRTGHHAGTVREGRWTRSPDFCYWDFPLIELAGLTFGVVGFGRIGRAVARIAAGFGMRVVTARHGNLKSDEGVEVMEMDEIFAVSDVVSLHCPLTEETRQLVNAERLGRMKPSAFLINTSRGALIDEAALASALNEGRLAGAGLDVLSVEPPTSDNPLLQARNCLITPHQAWATRAARERLMTVAVANVRAFLEGRLENRVG